MAYTPHTWVHNETITAALMNNIEDGIQECRHNLMTETLSAGSTSISFTDAKIGTATRISIKTSTGIAPLTQTVSGNTYTATFEAQSAAVLVGREVM